MILNNIIHWSKLLHTFLHIKNLVHIFKFKEC